MGGSVKRGGLRFEVFRRTRQEVYNVWAPGLCQCKLSEWVLRVFLSSTGISQ